MRRADGSRLLDGAKRVDATAELMGFELPAERDYRTLARLPHDRLRRLPSVDAGFEAFGGRREVVDTDGRRIDEVFATPSAAAARLTADAAEPGRGTGSDR